MIKELSVRFGDYLAKELTLDQRNRNITVYGLEVIIGGIIKTVIFVSLALLFNMFFQLITVLLVFGTIRWIAGGVHCSSYSRCMILSLVLMFGTAFLGIGLASHINPDKFLIASFVFGIFINCLYAPVDPPEKPINSIKKRNLLKLAACIQLGLYWLLFSRASFSADIAACAGLAVLVESITMSPWGIRLIHKIDACMEKIGERRCET